LKPKKAEETLYLYESFDYSDEPWATKYRVSLGPDQYPPPPPPTWREYLKPRGYTFNSQSDYERAYSEMWLMPEDVDQPLNGVSWENVWEFTESPQAKAHQLLADLNIATQRNLAARLATSSSPAGAVTQAVPSAGWISRMTSQSQSSRPA
jgi:hypothetical protein